MPDRPYKVVDSKAGDQEDLSPVRVLLLDDEPATLFTRAVILRRQGYLCMTAATFEEALALFDEIDIAVLDYHLGAGRFGSEVADLLRKSRPEVPIIILSATLNYFFGGAEDMHLLKGYSSNDHLVAALRSLDAKRRGAPIVVDPNQFFYSRICHAIGPGVLTQIFDAQGRWLYCNEDAADYLGHEREWFVGRSPADSLPEALRDWSQIVLDVAARRETYIDRTRNGLLGGVDSRRTDSVSSTDSGWTIAAFPIAIPSGDLGVVLTARNLATPPATLPS